MEENLTPVLKQYFKIKKKYKKEILLFRMGDFYEIFGEDAIFSSKVLNITLTSRYKGTEYEIPMCGFPYHASDKYISKLLSAGKKVAICEQLSPPGKGLVQRDVVEVLTWGTITDLSFLENKKNNYIICIVQENDKFGIAFSDVSCGDFQISEMDFKTIKDFLYKIMPSEILFAQNLIIDKRLNVFIKKLGIPITTFQSQAIFSPKDYLLEFFNIKTEKSLGIEKYQLGIKASAVLLEYLKDVSKTRLNQIQNIKYYNPNSYMILEENTIKGLEILETSMRRERTFSVLDILDETKTSMGSRLLRKWILNPLINQEKIKERQLAVKELIDKPDLLKELRNILSKIADIERLSSRIGNLKILPKELIALKECLKEVIKIRELLNIYNLKSNLLNEFKLNFNDPSEIINLIENSIKDDPPNLVTEGGIIKQGFNSEIDELRRITASTKEWILNMQVQEIKRTKIPKLKIGYNKIIGYYIEVSKSYLSKIPEDYIRKQTLVNSERFVTLKLKEYEEKVLSAEEKLKDLEFKLFQELKVKFLKYIKILKNLSNIISVLDVISNFAYIAIERNYCMPKINLGYEIIIKNGRHPVLELLDFETKYIPNDTYIDKKQRILVLTGPNMSGKSSYLRQVALIVIMAQIGSFVPAEKATIGICDKIFTRIGVADDIIHGLSTFMVEMVEVSNILRNATEKSLIILDEIGRGTSTYDGISIAWAVLEYIHNKIKARTLFATHYHELIKVAENLEYAKNFSFKVIEDQGKVVFLYKLQPGGTPKSYGIEVAKIAGVLDDVIKKAKEYLKILEERKEPKAIEQISLFDKF